jgi:putative membrane protein
MKRIVTLLILSAPVWALAASNPDESFFKHAAEGGMAEVEDGMLAQDKGNSQAVKDFGAMMVKDHSAANDKLQSLAASESVKLPESASITQGAEHDKLKVLSGDTFDKSYIKGQIKAHQQTVALFKKEIASGQDAGAKEFATATLPTIQAHLKSIRQIAATEGVTSK